MLREDRIEMVVGVSFKGKIHEVAGVRLSAVSAGIRYKDRPDLVLIELAEGTTVAGVFTQNAFCAAPVLIAKSHLSSSNPRIFIINTGNANAGTGEPGQQNAIKCCQIVAEHVQVSVEQVLPFSTGVIGEELPVEKIAAGVPQALDLLGANNWMDAAHGILTTDTRPKLVSKQIEVAGGVLTVTGMAKGAGMIRPNMATMLSYVFTDAIIDKDTLDKITARLVNGSFNRITIDGDTSTNDAAMLAATGKSEISISNLETKEQEKYFSCLQYVFERLAVELVKDAEGATKFITINISEGKDEQECLKVAYCVAESLLVKTALFASDPNWGRILAVIGRAGLESLEIYKVDIDVGNVRIVSGGKIADSYTEEDGQAVMKHEEICITINLGRGNAKETVWTSDLSHDYVRINADYRT